MDFHIYNTLTRKKELFVPIIEDENFKNKKNLLIEKKSVWIYSCWPTVYSNPHLWNLRAYIFAWLLWDIIRNVLWYRLIHVVNITDVWHLTDDWDNWQDKLEKWSKKEWLTAWEVANKYELNFKKYVQMLSLNFDYFPKATDNIQEQIDIVKSLEASWYTYIIENDWVYMDTSMVEDYWKLMWENYEKHIAWIKAWARIENSKKRNPTDFALWKFSPSDERRQMEWESPWWIWFPWWHIECTAMSRKYLWDSFDFHTWWIDHINIHHTNEIAQSECSFSKSKDWVKYWMHCQFLNIDWEKISKSLWHTVSIPDILDNDYSVSDLRYFYLTAHYRSFLDFTWDALSQSRKTRSNIIKKLASNKHIQSISISDLDINWLKDKISSKEWKEFLDNCLKNLLDDMNTPALLALINKNISSENYEIFSVIFWLDQNILKLKLLDDIKLFNQNENIKIPHYIYQLAQERRKEKLQKNFSKADEIRQKLLDQWYLVLDQWNSYNIVHKMDKK